MQPAQSSILPTIIAVQNRKEWPWKQNFKCSPYLAEPFASSPAFAKGYPSKPRSKSTQPETECLPKLPPARSRSSLEVAAPMKIEAASQCLPSIEPENPGAHMSGLELRGLLAYMNGAYPSATLDNYYCREKGLRFLGGE